MTQINHGRGSGAVMAWWRRCRAFPGGTRLFSRLLGWFVPYSGTIGARVEELRPGHARVSLRDRRRVRNHLDSIHAIALVNLGEIATGLALLTAIGDDMRAILVGIRAEYLKKARGRLVAIADFALPDRLDDNATCEVEACLTDASGEVVTRVQATWMVGYRPA